MWVSWINNWQYFIKSLWLHITRMNFAISGSYKGMSHVRCKAINCTIDEFGTYYLIDVVKFWYFNVQVHANVYMYIYIYIFVFHRQYTIHNSVISKCFKIKYFLQNRQLLYWPLLNRLWDQYSLLTKTKPFAGYTLVLALCERNSPQIGVLPSQRATVRCLFRWN